MKKYAVFVIVLVLFSGCVPTEKQIQTAIASTLTAMPTNTPIPTDTPVPTSTPTLTPTPTVEPTPSPTPAPLSLEEVIQFFIDAGIPIIDATYFDENTDPNQLIGRPNQYVGKVNFKDGRITGEEDIQAGGSIEMFLDPIDLRVRKQYLENVTKLFSFSVEYSYSNSYYLLRLSKALTPSQAEEYEAILMTIP